MDEQKKETESKPAEPTGQPQAQTQVPGKFTPPPKTPREVLREWQKLIDQMQQIVDRENGRWGP